ncbi:hypothetical protein LX97_01461 [Nonlabens dokdonensis]|jgi:hypothetical protein|uniref:Uncharacterized protein n=2 Tax=Nonlabens dokdonensis TaxID=328515 RepID=L7WAE8_NONDD|nr:hypothetical protein [Nonlabens dokdonensis]AGC76806.1 hypothetical protein DDD_1679 [Nonlabens dokdonensis DSW-6]PZX44450.1 hypothetical protein LX97_01461 [Nonlabens dokdonensis]
MKRQDLIKRFLTGTDKTGRFIVSSKITGITYFVEPIDNGKPDKLWGDIDPATNKLTGDYGNKSIGAVKEKNSLITKELGFLNISTFKGSPFGEIDRRDKIYTAQGR